VFLQLGHLWLSAMQRSENVVRFVTAAVDWQVLTPLLGPAELASIFGRVAQVFANSTADAFQRLQPQVPPLAVAALCSYQQG
jgi:hypothetical protein